MNEEIFYFLYNLAHQSVFLDRVIVFFAVYFPVVVIILAGLFLLFHHEVFKADKPFEILKQKYREIALVFAAGTLAWIFAHLFKFLFHAPRPIESLEGINLLFDKTGGGFPSGHAAFFTALAFAIFFTHKKASYVFMLLALLIGLARIAAGVHFPADVLGGFVLGGLVAYFAKNV